MTNLALEFVARLAGLAVGYFIIGAVLAWREVRADVRARVRQKAPVTRPDPANPYRSAPAAISAEEGSALREAWDAGVMAERARVVTIVAAVNDASADGAVNRACKAIRAVVEGGAK